LFVGTFVLFAALVGSWSSPAAAREEVDPFSLGDVYPPRVVVLDGVEVPDLSEVRLVDAAGREVPLTGEGVVREGSRILVQPPRLPAGAYTVSFPGGSRLVEVGSPQPTRTADSSERGSVLVYLPLLGLVPAAALFVVRRRRIGLLVATVSVASTGLLALAWAPSGDRVLPQGDPCLGSPDLTACATGHVVAVLEDFGPRRAVEELVRLSSAEGSPWSRVCHEPAHELGIRTWLASGVLEDAVAAGTTACSLGYVHGLLQAMGTYLDDGAFPSAARGLCDGLDERYRAGNLVGSVTDGPSTLLGCHHGVGHAAMWRFNEDLSAAMPVCAGFALPEQQEECRVGAVMEWVYASQRAARSGVMADRPSPQVSTPVELCLPPVGVLSPGCVEGAVTAVGPDGVEAARNWCLDHSEILPACVQSLARRMVQMDLANVSPFLASAGEFCTSLGGAFPAGECANRFGYMLLFLSRDLGRVEAFCAGLPADQLNGCRAGFEQVLEYARKTGDSSFAGVLSSAESDGSS
jgi:hypothetical protein